MALKPCKSCGHKVDASAKACPSCGVAHPAVSAGQQLAGVAILLVLLGGCWMVVWPSSDPQSDAGSTLARDQADVLVACQEAVRQQLRSPRSARFEFGSARKVAIRGDSAGVVSWVDAENAFGAEIRSEYVCVGSREEGGWSVEAHLDSR